MTSMAMRLLASALLGAILPLGFAGGLLVQSEGYVRQADRMAFHILLPVLLFALMAGALWILLQPVRRASISSAVR